MSEKRLYKRIKTNREFLIQLVGEKWVGKLSKVKLAQGAHAVYVLNVNIFCQIRDLFRVKFMPKEREKKCFGLHVFRNTMTL